jgi:hypothetical protein
MAKEHDRPRRDIVDPVLHRVRRCYGIRPQREDLPCQKPRVEEISHEVKREARQNNQCRCHGEYLTRACGRSRKR